MSQLSEALKALTKLGWFEQFIIEQVIAKYVFPIYIKTKHGKYEMNIKKLDD